MSQPERTDPEAAGIIRRLKQAFEARAEKEAAAPRPPAKVVQFPLPFPEDSPPVSNVIARSALFAAVNCSSRQSLIRF